MFHLEISRIFTLFHRFHIFRALYRYVTFFPFCFNQLQPSKVNRIPLKIGATLIDRNKSNDSLRISRIVPIDDLFHKSTIIGIICSIIPRNGF